MQDDLTVAMRLITLAAMVALLLPFILAAIAILSAGAISAEILRGSQAAATRVR